MLSTVGLELTNFIDPNLTWKKVTKGSRSTTRRSRKSAAMTFNMVAKLGFKRPRSGDSSVSESEKLGVDVLGRRFTDKPEHVPIKKRRLILRSPSPSPRIPNADYKIPLPFNEQTPASLASSEHILDCKYASGTLELFSDWQMEGVEGSGMVNSTSCINNNNVERRNIFEVLDDFSGIELLAAAACSDDAENSKDTHLVEEPSSQERLESNINVSLEDPPREHDAACSCNPEDSHVVSQEHHNEFVETHNKSVTLKDDRLHWDLNTVMAAWEEPCQKDLSEDARECAPQREDMESLKAENLTVSSVASRGDQLVSPGNINKLDHLASMDDSSNVDFFICNRRDEFIQKNFELPCSAGQLEGEPRKGSFKYHLDNACINNVSLSLDDDHFLNTSSGHHGHLDVVENMAKAHSGYDSPFEDGELRDSVICSWEENEADDLETECVDLESNYQDDSDTANYPTSSGKVDAGCENGEIPLLEGDVIEADFNKSSSVKSMDVHIEKELTGDDTFQVVKVAKTELNEGFVLDGRQSSDLSGENDSARKSHTSDHMDGLDVKGSHTGDIGSRIYRGKLLSRIEGPFFFFDGNDSLLLQQRRPQNFDGPYHHQRSFACDKSIGRDRLCSQLRHGDEGEDHFPDTSVSYLESRDRCATKYRGPEDHVGRTRPRTIDNDCYVAKLSRFNGQDDRHMNYSSKGLCRPSLRRRSPVDRDDVYSVRRGMPSVRGIGFDRSRGRSGICPPRMGRFPRGDFRDSVLDDVPASSLSMQHYLARRDRSSSSPSFGRGGYSARPRRKSCSRSKTRSPSWHLRREQSFVRRHSRSPDSRAETRMDRMRLPYQKRCFAADYEEQFNSSPRGRISFEHNSRWINDRNCTDDHFRGRRSPVRMVRPRQRFDSAGYASRRSKPDDVRRTMLHSGRFPLLVGPDKVHRYEDGNYDRLKHEKRYEPIRRVRRADIDGISRQSQYNAEDCFDQLKSLNNDDCIRAERRDLPSTAREERGPFRYNNDRLGSNGDTQDPDQNTASPART